MCKTKLVEFCLKIGGSPSKPKYKNITDSEKVLWRKGEKKRYGLNLEREIFY